MLKENAELVNKLVLSCNVLSMEGHNDITLGHVSARNRGSELVLMKSSGKALWEINADDIIAIDLDGNIVEGDKKCHVEYPIHTEIYRMREDVNCVIHTHPFYSTVFSASGLCMKPVSNEGTLFFNTPVFTKTTELIQTAEQGKAIALTLEQHNAVLLQNHGVVVVGSNIEEATVYAIRFEWAAKAQLFLEALGKYKYTSKDECINKIKQTYNQAQIQNYWNYFVRKLKAQNYMMQG